MSCEARVTKSIVEKSILALENLKDSSKLSDLKFTVRPALGKGDNFSCTLLKVAINVKIDNADRKYDIIAKVIPGDESREMLVRNSLMFDSELYFYSVLIPKLKDINEKIADKFPKILYTSMDEGVLMMSDLNIDGFSIGDRKLPMDSNSTKLVLENLALLHAVSHHLLEKEDSMEAIKKDRPYFLRDSWLIPKTKMNELVKSIQRNVLEGLPTVLENNGRPEEAEKMNRFKNSIQDIEEINEFIKLKDAKFLVLNHGDCWKSNIMLKLQDESLKDVKFIDLQMMRVGSPIIDILAFFGSSTDPITRMENWESWIEVYHGKLSEYLSQLGYDVDSRYSLQDLKNEMKKNGRHQFFFGAMMSMISLSSSNDDGGNMDSDNLASEDKLDQVWNDQPGMAFIKECSKNPLFNDRIMKLYKEAELNNVF